MDDLNTTIEQVNKIASQVGAKRGVTLQRLDTIDASSLTKQQKLTEPKIATPTASAGLSAQTQSLVQNYRTAAEKEVARLQEQQKTDKKGIKSILSRLSGVEENKQEMLEEQGVNDLRKEIDDITSQMESTDLAYRRRIEKVQDNAQGLFGGAVDQEVNRLERENARYQADLAIVLSAKNRQYDTAYNIIQQKAEAETEDLKLKLDAAKFFYSENKDALTTKEQRLFETMLTEDERAYTDAKDLVTFKGELQLEAAKNGAPSSLISQIGNATDRNAAMTLATPYLSTADNGAPTIKTINGVDMQWNPATQTWETPTTSGVSPADAKITDQVKFLQDTLQTAKELAGKKYAVGPSAITRATGDKLVGNTAFRQLETITQTLQTNILTLAGDPAIRKFFGPQMSERDVQMMVSSGTTLNPQNNSKEQYLKEIDRLNALLTKVGNAVASQSQTGGTLITAPDGTVVELID